MSEIALYNRWRPVDFDQVYGQDATVKILQEQIRTNTLPHSLLFYGPKGVGKTSVARIIAKAYNSHKSGTREIDASQDRKVENIRELIPSLNYSLIDGDFLTVIFDEAHQMTHDAFQALQKVVEEPPQDVRFIFVTTRVDKIPATIVDRSQRHCFVKIKRDEIYRRLKEVSSKQFDDKISDELLHYAVHIADGSLRSALVALEEISSLINVDCGDLDIAEMLGILGGPKLTNFVYLYLTQASKSNPDLKKLVDSLQMFESDRIDLSRAFSDLQQYLMDAIIYLKDESCTNTYFDVKPLLNRFTDNIRAGISTSQVKALMLPPLFKAYDLSLKWEKTLRETNNPSSVLKRYLFDLLDANASL